MRQLKLTRGMTALVDDRDFVLLNQRKWHAVKCNNTWYAATVTNGRQVLMHRLLLGETGVISHVDRDGLNNQRKNLRRVTRSEANCGRAAKTSTSSYFGVCLVKKSKYYSYWQATFKNQRLGYFNSELAAAIAYNEAALKEFGEYANLNKLPLIKTRQARPQRLRAYLLEPGDIFWYQGCEYLVRAVAKGLITFSVKHESSKPQYLKYTFGANSRQLVTLLSSTCEYYIQWST